MCAHAHTPALASINTTLNYLIRQKRPTAFLERKVNLTELEIFLHISSSTETRQHTVTEVSHSLQLGSS